MDTPRYNRCDSCGRNAHKVALRIPAGKHFPMARKVVGVCSSCFDDYFKWCGGYRPETTEVVYDRRGTAAKNRYPMPGHKPAETVAEATERVQANPKRATVVGYKGRALWKWCLHPAEVDAFDCCMTCGADLS